MKEISVFLFLMIMAGCASHQPRILPSTQYSNHNQADVKAGVMKWSDYYKGLYDAISKDNTPTDGDSMLVMNQLINTALEYESNKISEDEFNNARRIAKAKFAKIESDHLMRMKQIEASRPPPEPFVYKPYIRKSPPIQNQPLNLPKQTNCTTYGNQTNCTTY